MANTQLVAIVNVTPDSFSDGGLYFDPASAIAGIEQFTQDGAVIIDIGAESTRPGATPLTPEEEWQRLQPLLQQLPAGPRYSLDTRHANNARQSLNYSIDWINDVSGFSDPAMIEAVAASHCKLVVMHSLSVPADKANVLPENIDPVEEVLAFGKERIDALQKQGIARERIIFDPGIGFGKTGRQSQMLLDHIARFKTLNVPLLVGHSRKSFLSKQGDTLAQRDEATLAISSRLIEAGVDYLRVHNVRAHRALLKQEAA